MISSATELLRRLDTTGLIACDATERGATIDATEVGHTEVGGGCAPRRAADIDWSRGHLAERVPALRKAAQSVDFREEVGSMHVPREPGPSELGVDGRAEEALALASAVPFGGRPRATAGDLVLTRLTMRLMLRSVSRPAGGGLIGLNGDADRLQYLANGEAARSSSSLAPKKGTVGDVAGEGVENEMRRPTTVAASGGRPCSRCRVVALVGVGTMSIGAVPGASEISSTAVAAAMTAAVD